MELIEQSIAELERWRAPMPKHDEYRKKARDCVAQAEMMQRPNERAIMLQVAQGYLKLADMAGERYDRAAAYRDQDAHHENDR